MSSTPPPGAEGDRLAEAVKGRRILHVALVALVVVPAVVVALRASPSRDALSRPVESASQSVPNFELELFAGGAFELATHLRDDGRPLVLNFWASWCLPCREEMPAFDTIARQRPEIFFLGVAVSDTEPEARAFATEIAVSYPLGLDTDGTIAGLYPILGLPTTLFITDDGTIATKYVGQLDQDHLNLLIDQHLTG